MQIRENLLKSCITVTTLIRNTVNSLFDNDVKVTQNILLFFIIVLLQSCISNKFIDTTSTYEEWNNTPMNSKFLKIKMIDSETNKKVKDRSYYFAQYRGDKNSVIVSLVEVHNKQNIMNIFPLPSNRASIDIVGGELFPPPSVILTGLRISAEYKQDSGFFCFNQYHIYRNSNISEKANSFQETNVKIDFINKSGVLIDTTYNNENKIWF